MAKKQKKKSATTKRSKAARRPTAKRARPARGRARKATAPKPAGLNLKELRLQLESAVRVLSSGTYAQARGLSLEGADVARARFSDFMSGIDEICDRGGCGPDMVFPVN